LTPAGRCPYTLQDGEADVANLLSADMRSDLRLTTRGYARLYREAIAAVDDARRRELAAEMQRVDYTHGGYIIPFFPGVIDSYARLRLQEHLAVMRPRWVTRGQP
jgi:hypothetical protein